MYNLQKIEELKKENDAVILAHYYVKPEIQKVADYVGDSFYLARVARELDNRMVVLAGVYFMAESVKILNPDKRVFLMNTSSDCPMAHMVDVDRIRSMRERYEDLAVVTYINSTAEIKAVSDVCVTSSNAVKIVEGLKEENIFFAPDRNLGAYVASKVEGKNLILNDGYCPVHDSIRIRQVEELVSKLDQDRVRIMVHPECPKKILDRADYIGSTKGIIENVSNFSESDEYIILTEKGIEAELRKEFPERKFHFLDDFICPDMKLATMEDLEAILLGERDDEEVIVDSDISDRAKLPLRRMLKLGAANSKKEVGSTKEAGSTEEAGSTDEAETIETDTVIVGSGVAGLICALKLPEENKVTLITRKNLDDSNSSLAQGGISISLGDFDREDYIEDTMRAGHYKNNLEAVEILVDESQAAARDLLDYGVQFDKKEDCETSANSDTGSNSKDPLDPYRRTREGGHCKSRIMHFEDRTGRAIMDALIDQVKKRPNITIMEDCEMKDIISQDNLCLGVVAEKDGRKLIINSIYTVLATGGIGGIYKNTTSFPHIKGDAIALAAEHNVRLKDMSYVQIHPTTLYETEPGRSFLVSEAVRGEGAKLRNHRGQRFVNELLPRDVVSGKIFEQMKDEEVEFEWLDCREEEVDFRQRFPGIFQQLDKNGIDPDKDLVPVTPGQHYTMGGIDVDMGSETSMRNLFAAGEVACTGVHGQNRLASNSLLECVVFGKRAARSIAKREDGLKRAGSEVVPKRALTDDEKKEIVRERVRKDAASKTE